MSGEARSTCAQAQLVECIRVVGLIGLGLGWLRVSVCAWAWWVAGYFELYELKKGRRRSQTQLAECWVKRMYGGVWVFGSGGGGGV